MDPISYGVAAKQKQRIEKVIAEPDSTSGVITTPSVIASGETVTVPAGRVATLPNATVEGTLVVDGEVFIPSGSNYTTTEINVSGAGSKITGDFSNATYSNRTRLVTSTTDAATAVEVTPNGTNTAGFVIVSNSSDLDNNSYVDIEATSTVTALRSDKRGTGSYLPLTVNVGGAERVRIDTTGNVGISITDFSETGANAKFAIAGGGINLDNTQVLAWGGGTGRPSVKGNKSTGILNLSGTNGVLVDTGTLGYGTGAGGTVTQATSKSTAVTLNKPSGLITTSSASLAAGAAITFSVSNTSVTLSSTVVLSFPTSTISMSNYRIEAYQVLNGSFAVRITNISGGALAESLPIQFNVLQGSQS